MRHHRGERRYPGLCSALHANQPAYIMAESGESVSYAELEGRSNRLAHFLRVNLAQPEAASL